MITRIAKLPLHNNVIIGRDLAEIFKPGMVYRVEELMGEIVISPLGEMALSKDVGEYPNVHGSIESIMTTGAYLTTIEEAMRLERNGDILHKN